MSFTLENFIKGFFILVFFKVCILWLIIYLIGKYLFDCWDKEVD